MRKSKDRTKSKFPLRDDNPLFYRNDEAWIVELIRELIDRKFYINRPTQYHFKHRKVNYYPSTDIITIDGIGRHSKTGAQAFLDLLEQMYPKRRGKKRDAVSLPERETPRSSKLILNIGLDNDETFGAPANDNSGSQDDLPA